MTPFDTTDLVREFGNFYLTLDHLFLIACILEGISSIQQLLQPLTIYWMPFLPQWHFQPKGYGKNIAEGLSL